MFAMNVREKLSRFLSSAKRVLVIARKPTWQEFQAMAKVTGIGILIVAVLAYIVFIVFAFSGF